MTTGRAQVGLDPLRTLIEAGSMAGFSDRRLLERFATAGRDRAAAEAAFSALVARHGASVLGVCRRSLGDEHAAEDAFQAVFLVLARRARSIRRPELLGPWLHGVSARVCRKARVRAARRVRHEAALIEQRSTIAGHAPEDLLLEAERTAVVHEEIGRLPERYRRAVVLCHFEGLTHAEAARRLNCRVGTVSSQLSRARNLLHGRLTQRGLAPTGALLAAALGPEASAAVIPPAALERATVLAALPFASDRLAGASLAGGLLGMGSRNLARVVRLCIAAMVCAVAVGAGVLTTGAGHRKDEPQSPPPADSSAVPRDFVPSLPSAVTSPPDWIGASAPFDVPRFFAAPPPAENAAPLYLDALFEFGTEVAICFPEGPERDRRKAATARRLEGFFEIYRALGKDPKGVAAEAIDARLADYDGGFAKLAEAQRRPRCVFQTSLGITARLPHVMDARQVSRVAALRVRRHLEGGQLNRALHDLSQVLRLSRDLLPRGGMIVGLVSVAMDRSAVYDMMVPFLISRELTVQHCDRLLKLLLEHEARSTDMYREALCAEYLEARATLRDLVLHQDRLRQEWKALGNDVGPSITAEVADQMLVSVLAGNGQLPQPDLRQRVQRLTNRFMSLRNTPDLDSLMARMTPEQQARQVEKLDTFYADRLALGSVPYCDRIKRFSSPSTAFLSLDIPTRVTKGLLPATGSFVQGIARGQALLRDAVGLTAVRRWQLRHGGALPPSLTVAANEAGLGAVPHDPYTGGAVQMTTIDGQPVVYCIGEDGRDDHGRKDSIRAPYLGDVLLRLPTP